MAMITRSSPLLAPEARRVRKKTFKAKNLGAASCRGSKGAPVRATRSHWGRTLGLLGHSLEKEARTAVSAVSWPTSGRPVCLNPKAIAARYPATVPGASCLSQKR